MPLFERWMNNLLRFSGQVLLRVGSLFFKRINGEKLGCRVEIEDANL